MLKIVLASQSPRRKKLLEQIGLNFTVIPSTVDEVISYTSPIEIVIDLAVQKAQDVAKSAPNSLIIGADTIVVQNDRILGKPKNEHDAINMLKSLSDKKHSVFTGVSLLITGHDTVIKKSHSFFEETKVTFSALTDLEIKSYVASGSPMDKAGSYGIQDDWGSVFVERIEGDYYNVVGFPVNRFYQELKKLEPSLLNSVIIPKVYT